MTNIMGNSLLLDIGFRDWETKERKNGATVWKI
jgi:hypothetical protein